MQAQNANINHNGPDSPVIQFNAVFPFFGPEERSMVFNCTEAQFMVGWAEYAEGAMMQDAFHFLNVDEREFMISGCYPDEFEQAAR